MLKLAVVLWTRHGQPSILICDINPADHFISNAPVGICAFQPVLLHNLYALTNQTMYPRTLCFVEAVKALLLPRKATDNQWNCHQYSS